MSKFTYQKLKNILDRLLSSILLLLLSPLFICIYCLNLIFLGRPVIFKQIRPGYKNKLFTIYKFRTMDIFQNKDISPHDQSRINLLGKFLRKFSLDEIPQIFNIVKGDMSFVGPRPLLEEYLSLYSQEQMQRHLVKPGITGLAQVSGRNSLSWIDKFKMDIRYVEKQSFWLDLKIIFLTFGKVLQSNGINSSKELTSIPFKGNVDEHK